jgi:hypothetical protein
VVEDQGLGLLRSVRVVRAGIDLELAGHLPAQGAFGQHALDREAYDLFGSLGQQFDVTASPEATGIAGVAVVDLALSLAGCEHDLGGVDDDHVVASIEVRRENGLVLASEDSRHFSRETAEDRAVSVDFVPVALYL